MTQSDNISNYLDAAIAQGLYSNQQKLDFHLSSIYGDLGFAGKRVVDIGGGNGLHTFYAASRGASEVICLEPESEGSSGGMNQRFKSLMETLGVDNVTLEAATLQEFDSAGRQFDIVMLHDAINHLDEPNCVTLLEKEASREAYLGVFKQLFDISAPGATVIICDCSRKNLFATLGVTNPFVPTIEWHKHQAPETWQALLQQVGFVDGKITWTSFNRLGNAGKSITGNKLASYFLTSHFCLTMRKKS